MRSVAVVLAGCAISIVAVFGQGRGPAVPPNPPLQGGGGTVEGSVTTSDSQPVQYLGMVAVGRRADNESLFYATSTDKTGHYVIAGLPSGMYTVCTQADLRSLLDPCTWKKASPVQVSSAATQEVNVTLERGIKVVVVIKDPAGVLQAKGSNMPVLILQSNAGNPLVPLHPGATAPSEIHYSAVVPPATAYQISVVTNGLKLTSARQGVVVDGTAVAVSVPPFNTSVSTAQSVASPFRSIPKTAKDELVLDVFSVASAVN